MFTFQGGGIGLIQVKEEGWTRFSEGWQGCSEGFPEGKARGNSLGAGTTIRDFFGTMAFMQEKQQKIVFEIE